MIRHYSSLLNRFSRIQITLITTLFCDFFAVLFSFIVMQVSGREGTLFAMIVAFSITSIITPPVAFHFLKFYKQLQESNKKIKQTLAEVKELKGLIPICSSCHNIRDDSGYWKRIEEYVMQQTNAELSHSICPNCKDKLLDDYKQGTM